MSHYEQRLERDLNHINTRMEALTDNIEQALKNAVHALLTGNESLAYNTILADGPINRKSREIDRLCHNFIAVHLPSAGHLRRMSAIMRANIALERIGDYAVTISRESILLSRPPADIVAREIELMAEESRHMLNQAVAAFNQHNAEMAKSTMGMADQIERTFDTVFAELITEGERWSTTELFALFSVFYMLERVSDQAKNLCEEAVFAVSGETKPKKIYRILFLDEDNAGASQMAEAVARKTFPGSGEYRSAGRQALTNINESMVRFLEDRGIDVSSLQPTTLEPVHQELADYHVMVALHGELKDYCEIPFHCVALNWDIGPVPEGLDERETLKRFEEMYREISVQLRDLMETLRGEDAP